MTLPAPKLSSVVPRIPSGPAAAAPRKVRRPLIRSRLVSTLPVKPETEIPAASKSSPRRMSLNADPARPSVDSKRASTDAADAPSGASLKARKRISMLTPAGSSLNTAQSKPEPPM
ncbi:hypothetical protein FQZ97_803900 [compost metagenome]